MEKDKINYVAFFISLNYLHMPVKTIIAKTHVA